MQIKISMEMEMELLNPTNESILKTISRKVEIIVYDELGKETRFKEEMLTMNVKNDIKQSCLYLNILSAIYYGKERICSHNGSNRNRVVG